VSHTVTKLAYLHKTTAQNTDEQRSTDQNKGACVLAVVHDECSTL
jgi:hypothetical protein